MFGFLRLPELIILAILVILLFGAKNIPNLAKGIGQSITEFKKATGKPEDEPAKEATKE